jgi:hypothetical protein
MKFTMIRTLSPFVAAIIATVSLGCGGSGGQSGQSVVGKVALDGKPLEKGKVVLSHVDGFTAATGEITNGEFRLRPSDGAVPGKYRVSIHSEKKTGKSIPHPDVYGSKIEEVVEAVPAVYNVNTKLEAEIKADGENSLDFALATPTKSKSPVRKR